MDKDKQKGQGQTHIHMDIEMCFLFNKPHINTTSLLLVVLCRNYTQSTPISLFPCYVCFIYYVFLIILNFVGRRGT